MHDRKDDNTGTSEMKAFGEELLATGARYIDAGRRWLSERRDQMTSRDGDDDRHEPERHGGRRAYRDAPHRRDAHGWSRDDDQGGGYGDPAIAQQREWRRQQGPRGHDDRSRTAEGYGAGAPYAQFARSQDPHEAHGGAGRAYGAGGRADLRDSDDRLSDWGHRAPRWYNDVDHLGGAPDFAHFGAYDREGRVGRATPGGEPGRASGRGFRGVGPKGYARSDARITEDVCEQLTHSDEIDAREVSVRVHDGVVTLEGHVDQRWVKHRIEDIAEACSGVKDVENRIRVRGAGRWQAGGDDDGTSEATGRGPSGATSSGGTPSTGTSTGAPPAAGPGAAGPLSTSARGHETGGAAGDLASGAHRDAGTSSSQGGPGGAGSGRAPEPR
ncbi:BON domain-containing protein [Luteimonas sp. FCS-9]|uniref:BON domain-containing protein n=1 Tax=Luteimonas sp. FCS-9 TaxID=1547516 RepID=UPI00069C755F|nr:BON domain-containing protein [Luteimonas sp. FCS-9]